MPHPKHQIAILGAGPTGLEAALAASDAGRSFALYEAGPAVASYVRSWSHVGLFSPWDLDVSPRMRRHLEAAGHDVPSGDSCPSGAELVDRIFEPIAQLPHVAGSLRLGIRVVSITREGLLKNERIGSSDRSDPPFRLLLTDATGREWIERADVVLDCTGNYGHPNSLGDGGIPAPGEQALTDEITRTLPDFEANPEVWRGQRILLVGAGYSALTAAVALTELSRTQPETRITWALRSERPTFTPDPDDPLPERSRLVARAQEILQGASPTFEILSGVVVDGLARAEDNLLVTFRAADGSASTLAVDRILSLTGYVGDASLYRQLQVHECWATSGPMKLAAALLGAQSADCLTQETHGVETLINPEPDFFLLGSKSYGRNSTFLMKVGWDQVGEIFSLLAAEYDRSLQQV